MLAKLLQLYSTLGDPMDCNPPVSPVMGFSRQEYWSGLPFPSLGIFPTQGLNLHLLHVLHCQAGSVQPAPPGNLFFFFKSVWQSLPFSLFTVNVVIDLVSIRLSLVLFALVLSFVLWFLSSCFVLY